jgi:hypothetical protein
MADARLRLPEDLAGLTRSEWGMILTEARYSQIDAEIVRIYIMDGIAQIDTATELERDRKTIYRKLHRVIIPRAREVANKLNMI